MAVCQASSAPLGSRRLKTSTEAASASLDWATSLETFLSFLRQEKPMPEENRTSMDFCWKVFIGRLLVLSLDFQLSVRCGHKKARLVGQPVAAPALGATTMSTATRERFISPRPHGGRRRGWRTGNAECAVRSAGRSF